MNNEQREYRLEEISDEQQVIRANIRQLQSKLGTLANEAWGIQCDIIYEVQHADS